MKLSLFLYLLGMTLALSASLEAGDADAASKKAQAVTVKWLGHACFQLIPASGPRIVIDPFHAGIGTYPWPNPSADVLLVTHEHFDHNAVERVSGHPALLRSAGGVGVRAEDGVSFAGIAAFHDDKKGAERGSDTIYAFTLDKIRFCHLGDLGQSALTPEQLKAIGHVDVLFIPVGGYFTIDAKGADRIIAQIKPKAVVPMHYKTPLTSPTLPISDAKAFLAGKAKVVHLKDSTWIVAASNLPSGTEIVVFQPPSSH